METATFGAGCFWGVESAVRELPGVSDAAVGYMGGQKRHPTYGDVCTDTTGHAEVCQVTFDPARLRYEALVEYFFNQHDPTQRNRQGPDIGTQYRSVIFFHTAAQEQTARTVKERLERSGKFPRPLATELAPAGEFWRAEEYHQRYFEKHGLPRCQMVAQ